MNLLYLQFVLPLFDVLHHRDEGGIVSAALVEAVQGAPARVVELTRMIHGQDLMLAGIQEFNVLSDLNGGMDLVAVALGHLLPAVVAHAPQGAVILDVDGGAAACRGEGHAGIDLHQLTHVAAHVGGTQRAVGVGADTPQVALLIHDEEVIVTQRNVLDLEAQLDLGQIRVIRGAVAAELVDLGLYYGSPAIMGEKIYMYLATGLSFKKQHLGDDEFLDVTKLKLEDAVKEQNFELAAELRDKIKEMEESK